MNKGNHGRDCGGEWGRMGLMICVSQQLGPIIQFCSQGKQFQIDSMRQANSSVSVTSYLDVSQFILKEPSPLIKPSSPPNGQAHQVTPLNCARFFKQLSRRSPTDNPIAQICMHMLLFISHIIQMPRSQHTPEIAPIDHDPTLFLLTPLAGVSPTPQNSDLLDDFVLDSAPTPPKPAHRQKRSKRQPKWSLALPMFSLDSQLERIVENDYQGSDAESILSSQIDSSQSESEEDLGNTLSSCVYSTWMFRTKSKEYSLRDTEEERQSTIDISVVDYSEAIARFAKNPKNDILRKVKEIEAMESEEDQRKSLLKKFLEKYLLDYETHCFEQAWKELTHTFAACVKTIVLGLDQTFSKRIGSLPFESRRVKLLKYLQKKKRRIWRKKVSYDCRKKVADGRLRIKGKFVTREQACEQLGLESLDNYSAQQIKEMLQRRMDEGLAQQMVC